MTKKQIELMKHTTSDHNRNWFATNYNCDDSKEFENLVKNGYAISQKADEWMGDEVIYHLTEKGIEYLNEVKK